MAKRLYQDQDRCPVARTLNVLGDRWTLLIIRDMLVFHRKRFSELLESLRGLSPNLLSQRLKQLEDAGIVERHMYSQHPPRMEYQLTEKGMALGPILAAMRDWGNEYEPLPNSTCR